jgi:succinoglycan biosynthesis protein ExoA
MWIAVAPSSDDTSAVVREATADDDRFVVIDNPNESLAHALNLGLGASTSDVVAILSGHCLPDSHYLSACVDGLRRTRAGVVGGATRSRGERLLPGAIAIAHRVAFGLGGGAFRDETREGWVDTVYVGAYPRAMFDEIGPWNEGLARNQDIELNARVRRAGYGVYLSREVVVEYRPRATLTGLARQNYGNGYWNIRTLEATGGVLSIRHLVPGFFVASVALGVLGAIVGAIAHAPILLGASVLLTVAVLVLYGLAAVVASIQAGARFGMRYAFVLPLVFATLHASYGLGEVVGLVRAPFDARSAR